MAKSENTRHYRGRGKDSTCHIVGEVLSQFPETRSSDRRLLVKVYEVILRREGKLDEQTSGTAALQLASDADLPSPQTIGRWRRSYQDRQMHLPSDPHVAISRERHQAAAKRNAAGCVRCPDCGAELFCVACESRSAEAYAVASAGLLDTVSDDDAAAVADDDVGEFDLDLSSDDDGACQGLVAA